MTIREIYKAGGVKGVLRATREGWSDGGGTQEFLRCVRYDWPVWLGIVLALVTQDFVILTVFAVMAALSTSIREWTNRSYKKMLEEYGAMVDRQQDIIEAYQAKYFHPSDKSAKARAARLN